MAQFIRISQSIIPSIPLSYSSQRAAVDNRDKVLLGTSAGRLEVGLERGSVYCSLLYVYG